VGLEFPSEQVVFVLECIECLARSEEARGWKAYLNEETLEVYVYCPVCAHREFEAD
jgi:hypothetical protein